MDAEWVVAIVTTMTFAGGLIGAGISERRQRERTLEERINAAIDAKIGASILNLLEVREALEQQMRAEGEKFTDLLGRASEDAAATRRELEEATAAGREISSLAGLQRELTEIRLRKDALLRKSLDTQQQLEKEMDEEFAQHPDDTEAKNLAYERYRAGSAAQVNPLNEQAAVLENREHEILRELNALFESEPDSASLVHSEQDGRPSEEIGGAGRSSE